MVETMTLGERIRTARQRARLTQEQLAAKVGKSRRTIDNWENDRTAPANLIALEDVLGSLEGPESTDADEGDRLVDPDERFAMERTTYKGALLEIVTDLEADTDDLPDEAAHEIIRRSIERMRAQMPIVTEMERRRWEREQGQGQT